MNHLIFCESIAQVLQSTGRKPCIKKAETLFKSEEVSSLHLRNLALQREEALLIAAVFKDMQIQDNKQLRSVSFSYNDQLTDEGAVALINALPESVTEIGMVGCGLTDRAGKSILKWLDQSLNLRMVCIEGNHFSAELRSLMRKQQLKEPALTFMF